LLELSAPVVVSLEVTDRCNSRCPGCSNVFTPGGNALSLDQWERILEGLAPYVHEYRVTGGEPTLKDDILDLLRLLDRQKRYFHIFTNGRWNDRDALIDGFKTLQYLATFLISLHGPDADSHMAFTGEDTFCDATETIARAVAAGLEVNTNTVLTRSNFRRIEEVAALSHSLGARSAVFARYIGHPCEGLTLTDEELKEALAAIEGLVSRGYNVSLGNCIPHCFFESTTSGCSAGITFATVDPYGNVRPCNHSPVIGGNLLREDITKIWKSKTMRAFRNAVPGECRRCRRLTYCPGGCKAMAGLLGVPRDPLIRSRVVHKDEPTLMEVTLEDELCPVPRYAVRREDFGWALIRQSQVIPVSSKAGRVIQTFDGKTDLRAIEKKFGAAALSFVYSLYVRDFIELRSPDSE
jgi:radical SAM protein with 4Fe4S-binding SPASM domain